MSTYVNIFCKHVVRQLVFIDHIVICGCTSKSNAEKKAKQSAQEESASIEQCSKRSAHCGRVDSPSSESPDRSFHWNWLRSDNSLSTRPRRCECPAACDCASCAWKSRSTERSSSRKDESEGHFCTLEQMSLILVAQSSLFK